MKTIQYLLTHLTFCILQPLVLENTGYKKDVVKTENVRHCDWSVLGNITNKYQSVVPTVLHNPLFLVCYCMTVVLV